jgi:hypothetical protein
VWIGSYVSFYILSFALRNDRLDLGSSEKDVLTLPV